MSGKRNESDDYPRPTGYEDLSDDELLARIAALDPEKYPLVPPVRNVCRANGIEWE